MKFKYMKSLLLIAIISQFLGCKSVEQAWKSSKEKTKEVVETVSKETKKVVKSTKKMASSVAKQANHATKAVARFFGFSSCKTNKDCTSKKRSICDVSRGKCVECLTSTHCNARKRKKVCEPTKKICLECLKDRDCPRLHRSLRACKASRCVMCTTNRHCKSWQLCSKHVCKRDKALFVNVTFLACLLAIFLPLGIRLMWGSIKQRESLKRISIFFLLSGPLVGMFAPVYLDLERVNLLFPMIGGILLTTVGIGCLLASFWKDAGYALGFLSSSFGIHLFLEKKSSLVGPNPIELRYFVLGALFLSVLFFSLSWRFKPSEEEQKEEGSGQKVITILGILGAIAEIVFLIISWY